MRIHVIRAPTLPAALAQVRDAFGDEAIVLDTAESAQGVAIRIGIESDIPASPQAPGAASPAAASGPAAVVAQARTKAVSSVADRVAEALAWHGAPPLVTRSLLLAVEADSADTPEAALANALNRVFRFGRPDNLATPLALVGPPGSGKTATLAKLAAARSLAGADIALINADIETAGARERIGAFAAALEVTAHEANAAADIDAAIAKIGPDTAIFVDTSGRAPADAEDIDGLAQEIAAAGNGVLVLPATTAPVEAAELAECFAAAGATELIMTQLDIARRVGGLLAAADAGDLIIAGVSVGRRVGDGLKALTGASLARLILATPLPLAKPRRPAAVSRPVTSYAAHGAAA